MKNKTHLRREARCANALRLPLCKVCRKRRLLPTTARRAQQPRAPRRAVGRPAQEPLKVRRRACNAERAANE